MKKYSAHKEFEDLSALKQTRLNNRKWKNVSSEKERPAKQQKIEDCANAKFSRDDQRHVYSTLFAEYTNFFPCETWFLERNSAFFLWNVEKRQ